MKNILQTNSHRPLDQNFTALHFSPMNVLHILEGRTDGQRDGRTKGWTDKRKEERMDGCMDGWVGEWLGE